MRTMVALVLSLLAATSSAAEVVREFQIPWTRVQLSETRWYDRPSPVVMQQFKESGCSFWLKALADEWDRFDDAAKDGRADMDQFNLLKKETFEAQKGIRLVCRGDSRFQTTGVSGN